MKHKVHKLCSFCIKTYRISVQDNKKENDICSYPIKDTANTKSAFVDFSYRNAYNKNENI